MYLSVRYGSPQVAPLRPDNVFIYQIYYDEKSRAQLDGGFLPLDNTANERPDWYEFWVMRNFLNTTALKPNAWYGFLSSKFRQKTGLTSEFVYSELAGLDSSVDAALFSSYPDHLAFYQNPFEQGEICHPGLSSLTQDFIRRIGLTGNPLESVGCLKNSVFSNYIVAKPRYWEQWLRTANAFFDFVENNSEEARAFAADTLYDGRLVQAKTFVQERFATLILSTGIYRTHVPAKILNFADYPSELSRLLVACDVLKDLYCATGNPEHLSAYKRVRAAGFTEESQVA